MKTFQGETQLTNYATRHLFVSVYNITFTITSAFVTELSPLTMQDFELNITKMSGK